MPPKKVDAETKEKQYQAYLESQEYLKVCEIYDDITTNLINLHSPNDPFISQTSQDFDVNGRHQKFWDKLYELAVLMKIKPPFKRLEHQWLRSSYFGQKIKVNKDDQVYTIDGNVCQFEPEYADAQRHIKQTLHKSITNFIRDKQDNYDIDNYIKTRAEVKKGYNQLFKYLKTYIKKPFKVIYEQKFLTVLKPYSDLLEINMKYVMYELKYQGNQDDNFVNDFKRKAIIDRYCECLEQVIHLLMMYHSKPIKFKIKPHNVFKKIDYKNLSTIQKFYLKPFNEAFNTMKEHLCAQFTTGINFWKVPVEKNSVFVTDLKELVDWELVTQRHFGNTLLRDQINFVSDVLNSIDKANQLAKNYMITKDPNSIELSIPKLIAFRTIQYMRNYKDKQKQIEIKQQQRLRIMGKNAKSNEEEEENIAEKSLTGSPSNTKNAFAKGAQSQVKPIKGLKLLRKDSLQEARQNLGRYWLWQNYCDEGFKNSTIEEAVEKLKHVNKAVQQDIEDSIIRQGMLPKKDRHDEERIMARDTIKNMKTIHNADKPQNMKRPPQLWNFPQVLEQQHRFRSIAQPKKCYIDGRIQELDSMLIKIGEHLRTHQSRDWNQLIRRVIDFYKGTPDQYPGFTD